MKTIAVAIITAFLALAAEKAPKQPEIPAKIQVTLGKLVEARPALTKLFAMELPVKTAWSLRKTIAVIEAELKRFEEQRVALVKKYAKEKNGTFSVPPEKAGVFSEEYKTLADIPADLSGAERVPLAVLGDVKLSASDMQNLEPFLLP